MRLDQVLKLMREWRCKIALIGMKVRQFQILLILLLAKMAIFSIAYAKYRIFLRKGIKGLGDISWVYLPNQILPRRNNPRRFVWRYLLIIATQAQNCGSMASPCFFNQDEVTTALPGGDTGRP